VQGLYRTWRLESCIYFIFGNTLKPPPHFSPHFLGGLGAAFFPTAMR
jgi:hypothetical protein